MEAIKSFSRVLSIDSRQVEACLNIALLMSCIKQEDMEYDCLVVIFESEHFYRMSLIWKRYIYRKLLGQSFRLSKMKKVHQYAEAWFRMVCHFPFNFR